jgi:NAD(P)-dependent dehydrogenase (short-subunit alcohol dehydrogenase family)
VPITFLEIDLASFESIQTGAKKFLSLSSRLDILICNAGIMALPPGLTKDGYELQFGTNFLGHALLTKLLFLTLLSTAKEPNTDVRIVFLSSLAFSGHPMGGIVFKDLKTKQDNFLLGGPWQRYGQSKLAAILYAAELSRRYKDSGIMFLSIHPGTFNTGLIQTLGLANRAMIWITNVGNVRDEKKDGEGAWNSCWAATAKRDGIENGAFYVPVGVKGKKLRENSNDKLAGELYEWTDKELESWN